MTARVTGTYLERLKSGEKSPADVVSLVQRAAATAPGMAIVDALAGVPSDEQLYQWAMITRGDSRHFLLVVDSLHSLAHGRGGDSTEYDALNLAILSLGKLAGSLHCPVLVISERNRSSMGDGGLNAGAGTRRIEYGAETVIGMNTETEKFKDRRGQVISRPVPFDMNGERAVDAWIDKNRNGAAGVSIDLLFHGALQRFREG